MFKKVLFIVFTSLVVGSTTVMAQQSEQPKKITQPNQAEQAEQVTSNAALMDPYTYCYIAGKAYSEGIIVDGAGKCQARIFEDKPGKYKLYWEGNFYNQR